MAQSQERSDDGRIVCEKCGDAFDPRGISAHKSACDADPNQKSDDTEGARDNTGAIPGQDWWESHAEMLAELGGLKPQDGRTMADVAAQTWAKRAEMDKREAYVELFDICPVEGCENGKNGFTADTCATHTGEYTGDDGGESQDGETITVTINGDEVTGTPEDIRQLKGL
jgi:hypothetical protein